jgi:hypothetical protein
MIEIALNAPTTTMLDTIDPIPWAHDPRTDPDDVPPPNGPMPGEEDDLTADEEDMAREQEYLDSITDDPESGVPHLMTIDPYYSNM